MVYKEKNNEMISLQELIMLCFNNDNDKVYIPLLQRNYKWDKESAARLAEDLWDDFTLMDDPVRKKSPYTIGMITLYEKKVKDGDDSKLQLIDGQQRIITLTLLLKYLNPNEKYFKFEFERDINLDDTIKRSNYIDNLLESIEYSKGDAKYTDTIRFQENYEAMKTKLGPMDSASIREGFIKHILGNVYVLFHITDREPIQEFLNINKNKTRFVISDYIKSSLIIETPLEDEEKRKSILKLFEDLSGALYQYNDIWNLLKRGYECDSNDCKNNKKCDDVKCYKIKKDMNRLKILFCDRYVGNNKKGYEYEQEYDRLQYYSKILYDLLKEMGLEGEQVNNWNAYNAFCCLYARKKIKFFEMFGKDYDEKRSGRRLDEIIWSYFSLEEFVYLVMKKNTKDLNYFFESQLYTGKNDRAEYKILPDNNKNNEWQYIEQANEYEELNQVMYEYISYRKKALKLG